MLESWITRFRKNTFQNTLLLGVILVHFIFLVMILFLSPDSLRKKERKHLIVRTVAPQPQAQPKIAAVQKAPPRASAAPKAAPAPAPAPKPEAKKQIAAPPPQKKPAVAKEPAIAEKS